MEEKILKILEDLFDCSEIRDNRDVDLFEAGFLDSLGIVSLLVELESEFGLVLQPTDIERKQISSVDNIIALLKLKGVS